MSLRALFLAGKDGYKSARMMHAGTGGAPHAALHGLTLAEHHAVPAAQQALKIQNSYWDHRGWWVLDTGRQHELLQQHFDEWPEALQAAMVLPQDQKTADVIIRCRGYEAGGVNPFDDNPEPVTARLERLEQEWKERLAADAKHNPSRSSLKADRKRYAKAMANEHDEGK